MKLKVNLLIVLTLICFIFGVSSDTSPIRSTTSGKVQGIRKNVLGKEIDVFLGIPFAEPPVGERRFCRPEKIKPWDGIKTATKLPNACMQKIDKEFGDFEGSEMWNPNTEVSEDCLYLNVWQPVGGSANKAVLIWIYGGGFYSGSSSLSLYDGSVLAAEGDIVVMSMQYRVGPMGFFYLKNGQGDKAPARGSMGMVDQAMAIQWLHENAVIFEGNPDKITLLGESAGAGSASLHLLSPLTQKIIKSSIMLSGSAVAPWASDTSNMAHKVGIELATKLGCTSGNLTRDISSDERRTIMSCLQSADAQDVTDTQWELENEQDILYTAFVPVVDDYFLLKRPTEAAIKDARSRQSIMLGNVRNEGTFFLGYMLKEYFPNTPTPPKLTKEQYYDAVGKIFHFGKKFLTDSVAFEYGQSDDNYERSLDLILGDNCFNCPVLEFAKIYANAGKKVYLYNFNHRTSANPWPEWMGVMHGYEIDQIFGRPLDQPKEYKDTDKEFSKKIMKYWINFIKTGDPNTEQVNGRQTVEVAWPSYDIHNQKVISLNTTSFLVEKVTEYKNRKCQFWKTIYPQLKAVSDNALCSASTFSSRQVAEVMLGFLFIVLLTKLLH